MNKPLRTNNNVYKLESNIWNKSKLSSTCPWLLESHDGYRKKRYLQGELERQNFPSQKPRSSLSSKTPRPPC